MKVNAGPEPELPAMIVILRRPSHRQRRAGSSIRIHASESIEDQLSRQAALLRSPLCPSFALDLNAQCASVMGTGARGRGQR
jgi:hypothetical protein